MTEPFSQLTFPEMYERELVGPLFRPFAENIVESVRLSSGDRVLDVACGTGIVGRLAKERVGAGGKVVGVDVNPQMLAVARSVEPSIEFREGTADDLPLAEGEEFDAVLCQQGLQFFAEKLDAVREMHRALRSGGKLAVSTWRPDDEIPLGRELRRIAEEHLGPITDRRHSYGDHGPIESLLRDAGFENVQSKTISRVVRFPDAGVFVRMNAMALAGMSDRGKEMSDEDRVEAVNGIARDSQPAAAAYTVDGELAFEISSNVVTAST